MCFLRSLETLLRRRNSRLRFFVHNVRIHWRSRYAFLACLALRFFRLARRRFDTPALPRLLLALTPGDLVFEPLLSFLTFPFQFPL